MIAESNVTYGDMFTDSHGSKAGYIKVPMRVTKLDVEDILDTAFTGAVDWIEAIGVNKGVEGIVPFAEIVAKGGEIAFIVEGFLPEHDGNLIEFALDTEIFLKGMEMYFERYDYIESVSDIDAGIADTILQLALFQEVIFS